ncbi:MAG TPA: hypothetical protein VM121_10260 [Acidimicrobiales bacterium]|nr:hypothetical protein [Acidimicrobiales bacterium]
MSTSRVVSLSLAAAAGLHLAALPDHLEEGVLIAGFFAACAVLQLTAAFVVSGGAGPGARRVIIAGNVAVVGIWLVSRTVGVPFGPEAGTPEPVSALDSLSLVAELVAVGGLVLLGRARRVRLGAWKAGPVAALAMTSFLFAGAGMAVATPHHHDEPGAPHQHESPTVARHHTDPVVVVPSTDPSATHDHGTGPVAPHSH